MIPCIASASVPVTTSPYGTLTQELIARYAAKGVSRRPAELEAIDDFYDALINGGWISATPSTSDNLQDLSLFFIDPTGYSAGDAQKVAETKLLRFAGGVAPDYNLQFNNVSNSNFSMSLGLSATPGAGGTNFNTKVPLNFGVSGTSSRNRTMFAYITGTQASSFATWLHGRDTFSSPASEFGLRTHSVANTSLNFAFRNGSINATSQTYTDRTIFVTSRFNGDERIINGNADVGGTANTVAYNPGNDVIGGAAYWVDGVPGDSYDVKMGLCGFIKTGITASQAGALNAIIQDFVADLRATEEPFIAEGDGVPMGMFAAAF